MLEFQKDFRAIPINLVAWFKSVDYGIFPDRWSVPVLRTFIEYDNDEADSPVELIRIQHIFNSTMEPENDKDFLGLYPPHFTEEDVINEIKRWPKLYNAEIIND